MQRGYVKLWRKTFDAGWLQNHKLCIFWLWCLLKATHTEYDQIVGFQTVHLMPGDFIFGRKVAAEELNMSERSIRTNLDYLRKSKNMTIKTTNKFSIISIVNWNTYQTQETQNDQQNDQPVTNKRPATDHKQECKELKNVKNNIYTSEFLSFYNSYPKHKAKNDAWKAWKQQNGNRPPIDIILKAIEDQKGSDDWQKDNGQYIPFPATWLRAGRWADEINNDKQDTELEFVRKRYIEKEEKDGAF